GGPYLESGGLVVLEAEGFSQISSGSSHDWLLKSSQTGYTGTGYLQSWPDIDTTLAPTDLSSSPVVSYTIDFTTPGTYFVWVRAYAESAANDSLYLGLDGNLESVTGFDPGLWDWAGEETPNGAAVELAVTSSGLHTLNLWMREDGLQVDRILLTTDTTYIPDSFGPAESARQAGNTSIDLVVDRVIDYDYDPLYRLTGASYSTGELYEYDYDPVGNRLQQIIDGDTTSYLYDAANRLENVDGQDYTFDDNGNLEKTGTMTNTWDVANRLVETTRDAYTLEPIYNGVNDRIGQTVGGNTIYFALDIQGLPEVIQTSDGNSYLHLPGIIMTENITGEVRYLLSDGLGSVRQAVDESAVVVASYEFDPYGNPVDNSGGEPYGYTGEWWQDDIGLLHLRARWYLPETGTFLSRDLLSNVPEYIYASNNPVNRVDPSGYVDWSLCVIGINIASCALEFNDMLWSIARDVLAKNGNPDAYDKTSQVVNQHINRVMVPRMQTLNPNLYSAQYGWDCPTCLADNINLPTSWVTGFLGSPTPPPTPGPLPPVGNPGPPLPPNGDCPSQNPKTLKPIRIRLQNTGTGIPTEIIVFPPGTSHVIQANVNKTRSNLLSWIGFGADWLELIAIAPQIPSLPDVVALGDVGVTTAASYYSGETYLYQQPHPSLPPMTVIGQDVIVTSADAGGALLAKSILPALGFEAGGVGGGMLGYVGGQAVDVVATIASVVYDGSRLRGIPTYFSYAVLWEGWPPSQAILIHAQE
ncbi:RHS repeat domain-containing protein, partial [Chloroflexota bacterium]